MVINAAPRIAATLLLTAILVPQWQRAAGAAEPDYGYASFQRGYYLTAFGQATHRVEESGDVKSMTLLGELYAGGLDVTSSCPSMRTKVTVASMSRRSSS